MTNVGAIPLPAAVAAAALAVAVGEGGGDGIHQRWRRWRLGDGLVIARHPPARTFIRRPARCHPDGAACVHDATATDVAQ